MVTARWILLRMRNVSDKVLQKIKTHILCSINPFRESCISWNHTENSCRAGQATDDNMAHAYYMLNTSVCTHTHTYYFSATKMVTRRGLSASYTSIACLVIYVYCTITFQLMKTLSVSTVWTWIRDAKLNFESRILEKLNLNHSYQ